MVLQRVSADFLSSSSINISLNFLELFLSLLQRFRGLGELVVGLVKSDLKRLDFLSVISDVAVGLLSASGGLLGGILEALNGGVETIGLGLQALHLLADGVHVA